MAYLYYGSQPAYAFDDNTLAHIRTVTVAKLLRQESFVLTWSEKGTQRSLWMNPATPLVFEFQSKELRRLDRDWLAVLMDQANSSDGVILSEVIH